MRLYLHELRTQQLVYWRSREAAVFTFIFPLLLFVLLGSVYTGRIYGVPAPDALLAALISYGCATVCFAGLSIALVVRREAGILKRIRATPLRPPVYMAAALCSTMLTFAAVTVVLFVLGRVVFGTPFPSRPGSVILMVVLGSLCFAALGVGIAGLIRSSDGSSAVVNLIVLPMSFLTGAFGPTRHYPGFLRAIGDALPLKYLVNISDAVYLHQHSFWSQGTSIGVLAAWGVAGVIVAAYTFGWEPRSA
ncbi:MAG: ABC transporter permease [Actinobacteria bacterium]|nr:ABC transporter permease [Actinomycetota bacterium]